MSSPYSDELLQIRRPLWIALSDLFLDTELQDNDYRRIASQVLISGLSPEEVNQALWSEVFPVVAHNLQDVAGEWVGFNEEWLVQKIQSNLVTPNAGPVEGGLLTGAQVREVIRATWANVSNHLPDGYKIVANAT